MEWNIITCRSNNCRQYATSRVYSVCVLLLVSDKELLAPTPVQCYTELNTSCLQWSPSSHTKSWYSLSYYTVCIGQWAIVLHLSKDVSLGFTIVRSCNCRFLNSHCHFHLMVYGKVWIIYDLFGYTNKIPKYRKYFHPQRISCKMNCWGYCLDLKLGNCFDFNRGAGVSKQNMLSELWHTW